LLDAIRAFVKTQPTVDPYTYARDVRAQLGVTESPSDPDLDAKLSWDQVRELDRDPLFTVGGHGHTHRILEYLDDDALARELDTSLALLDKHLGRRVPHYSYPEGLAHCYSDRVVAALRARGVVACPTAEPGLNTMADDPFHWKRIMVA
jgi:peptidoglycan/xylan/chitin deacetylase (PgdA/CDA1 family)